LFLKLMGCFEDTTWMNKCGAVRLRRLRHPPKPNYYILSFTFKALIGSLLRYNITRKHSGSTPEARGCEILRTKAQDGAAHEALIRCLRFASFLTKTLKNDDIEMTILKRMGLCHDRVKGFAPVIARIVHCQIDKNWQQEGDNGGAIAELRPVHTAVPGLAAVDQLIA
jgi:hypothetical protein